MGLFSASPADRVSRLLVRGWLDDGEDVKLVSPDLRQRDVFWAITNRALVIVNLNNRKDPVARYPYGGAWQLFQGPIQRNSLGAVEHITLVHGVGEQVVGMVEGDRLGPTFLQFLDHFSGKHPLDN